MGTRSTYRVIETGKKDYVNGEWIDKPWQQKIMLMYFQYDGYPEGRPMDVAEFLNSGKVVNGISMSENAPVIFNGAGCLAAQLVEKFKDGPGGTYLHPVNHRGHCGEDYSYDILVDSDTKEIKMKAWDIGWGNRRNKKLFEGTPAEFITWVNEVWSKQE